MGVERVRDAVAHRYSALALALADRPPGLREARRSPKSAAAPPGGGLR